LTDGKIRVHEALPGEFSLALLIDELPLDEGLVIIALTRYHHLFFGYITSAASFFVPR
jgi:hypothetical protein